MIIGNLNNKVQLNTVEEQQAAKNRLQEERLMAAEDYSYEDEGGEYSNQPSAAELKVMKEIERIQKILEHRDLSTASLYSLKTISITKDCSDYIIGGSDGGATGALVNFIAIAAIKGIVAMKSELQNNKEFKEIYDIKNEFSWYKLLIESVPLMDLYWFHIQRANNLSNALNAFKKQLTQQLEEQQQKLLVLQEQRVNRESREAA